MGIDVTINPLPPEIPDPIPRDSDYTHAAYDPEYVERWWRILVQTERTMQRHRSPFGYGPHPTGTRSALTLQW